MFDKIRNEVEILKARHFTGHLKFCVEAGNIVMMAINTKIESGEIHDYEKEILNFCQEEKEFFGSIEFNFNFGTVVSNAWYITLNGNNLKDHLQNKKVFVFRGNK